MMYLSYFPNWLFFFKKFTIFKVNTIKKLGRNYGYELKYS